MAFRTNRISAGAASALCCALLSASTFGTAADSPAGLMAIDHVVSDYLALLAADPR